MLKFTPIILFVTFTSFAMASDVVGLTYLLEGRDAEGHIVFDRFEIKPNSEVSWQTATKGLACAGEAGVYKGEIDKEFKKKILHLAHQIFEEEKKSNPPNTHENGGNVQQLQVEWENKVSVIKLRSQSALLAEFIKQMSFAKALLNAESSLKVTASRLLNNKVKINFTSKGKNPWRLLLPKKIEEALYTKNATLLSYVEKPKKYDLNLESGKSLEVIVELKGDKKSTNEVDKIFYDSSLIAHRGLGQMEYKLRQNELEAKEIFICASLKKASGGHP